MVSPWFSGQVVSHIASDNIAGGRLADEMEGLCHASGGGAFLLEDLLEVEGGGRVHNPRRVRPPGNDGRRGPGGHDGMPEGKRRRGSVGRRHVDSGSVRKRRAPLHEGQDPARGLNDALQGELLDEHVRQTGRTLFLALGLLGVIVREQLYDEELACEPFRQGIATLPAFLPKLLVSMRASPVRQLADGPAQAIPSTWYPEST